MKTEYLIQVFTSHSDTWLHSNGNTFTGNVGYAKRCETEDEAYSIISKAPIGSYLIVPVYTVHQPQKAS